MRHTCSRFSGSAATQPRCRVGLSPATAPAPPRVLLPLNTPKLRYGGALPVTHAVLGVADGLNTQKPALMADALQQTLPPPPISKSDEVFLEAGVEFVWGTEGVDVAELNNLFEKVGFPRRDPARLALALSGTYRTVWIRAARKSRLAKLGQLLGFARATSDGSLSAVIWDVAVAPAWQRGGLGRALVERLTASLVTDGISTITLYAEPNVVALYEKLGYVSDPDGIKGVAFQSKHSKLGRSMAAAMQRQ